MATAARSADLDRCPGILTLHPAEDGWLARIRLPGGRISATQLEAVAQLARHGNDLVELTARANLQVRGLPEAAGPLAAQLLDAVGLLPSVTHERVRNILASPLAGRDQASLLPTDELVAELDRTLCADRDLAHLSGRFLFGVDDGSGLVLGQDLDVALVAERTDRSNYVEPLFTLMVGGLRTNASVGAAVAAGTALEAARAFLALGRHAGGRRWRLSALPGGGAAVAEELGLRIEQGPPNRGLDPSAQAPGLRTQRDGRVALTVLPRLGRLGSAGLTSVATAVRAWGSDVRLSPWRTLTIVDIHPLEAVDAMSELSRIGLETAPSGFQGLSACAGLGACSQAIVDVRAAAERRAASRAVDGAIEHWSACERRCGEPRAAVVRIAALAGRLLLTDRSGDRAATDVEEALALLADGGRRE